MTIYNTVIETNDTDSSGEIFFDIRSFSNKESAKRFLFEKLKELTNETPKEERCEKTRSSDYLTEFTVYSDDDNDEWDVRGKVVETELED